MGNTSSAAPPPPPPPPSRDSNNCIIDGITNEDLSTAKPSLYKCPSGWVQNNYVIRVDGIRFSYSSDVNSGICTNPYLDPCSAKMKTGWVGYDYGQTKSIARFGYGPLFNQYPNNVYIPDATPILNATQPDNTVKHPNAPDIWFFPNPPPSNWVELNLPNSSEAKIPSTYTCPEGWTQNKDKSDLSSGICTSEGRYDSSTKLPNTVPNGARISAWHWIKGPLYTLYYGPKYNKWPNNNNIPSLSEIFAMPPSDYVPFGIMNLSGFHEYDEKKTNVSTPSNFYYKQRPYYWPALNPPEQIERPPTVIYSQQNPEGSRPIIPQPIANPQLTPYIIPSVPTLRPEGLTDPKESSVTAPVIAPRPKGLTDPEGSRVIAPVIAPRPKGLTDPEGSRVIAPQINTYTSDVKKSPAPAPSKTIINGIPNEYLPYVIGGILLLIILLVVLLI